MTTRELVRGTESAVRSGMYAIPERLDDDGLARLDALSIVREGTQWMTAAGVRAWTEPGQGLRTDLGEKSPKLTITGFANLGLRGLRDRKTVRKYRAAWDHAVRMGWAEEVEPGDVVRLPDRAFEVGDDDGASDEPWQTIMVHFRCAYDLREFLERNRPLIEDGTITIDGLPMPGDEARDLERFARLFKRLTPDAQERFARYQAYRNERAADLPIDPLWGSECDQALIGSRPDAKGERLRRISSEIARRGL